MTTIEQVLYRNKSAILDLQTRERILNAMQYYMSLPCLRFLGLGGLGSGGEWRDVSGNGMDLSYNGNPVMNFTTQGAPYWDYDGAGDYHSHADNAHFDITGAETTVAAAIRGLTLGCWVRFDAAASGDEYIMSKFYTSTNNRSYLIERAANEKLIAYISNDGSALKGIASSNAMSASTWYFVALCYKPSTSLNVWINDTETTNTTSIPASIYNGNAVFEISGINTGGYGLLSGDVALPFVCACALSDTQIERLYNVSRGLFGV